MGSEETGACNKFLKERCEKTKTVPGTIENHYIRPLNDSTHLVKRVSSSKTSFKAVIGSEDRENLVDIAAEYFTLSYMTRIGG
jgi:hypothetical protein